MLSFDPPSVDFGGVPMRTTASGPFSIRNDGNAPAGVKLVLNAPAAFGLDSAGPLTVAAAGHADDGITFQPVDAATLTGEVSLAATAGTVLCLPLPPALTLSGSGI